MYTATLACAPNCITNQVSNMFWRNLGSSQATFTGHGKTNRCFVRQLLCLYPLPQVSHFRSPCPDDNFFFSKDEPSLDRRILSPDLSLSPSGGPSTTALPFFAEYWLVPFCGRLLGGEG